MQDLISRQAAIDALSLGKEMLIRVLDDIDVVGTDREKYSWGLGLIESYINDIKDLPTAQPDENAQEFIKLTARYSNGRPYYSIIYLEYDKNGVGHDFAGYSSYSLDIISDYLKKYFMPPAQPEPHEGHWIDKGDDGDWAWQIDGRGNSWHVWGCSECEKSVFAKSSYCPNCGAKMKGAQNG